MPRRTEEKKRWRETASICNLPLIILADFSLMQAFDYFDLEGKLQGQILNL
jgi:hypothetical protein